MYVASLDTCSIVIRCPSLPKKCLKMHFSASLIIVCIFKAKASLFLQPLTQTQRYGHQCSPPPGGRFLMPIQKMATDGSLGCREGRRWSRGELCHQPLWHPAPQDGRSDKALENPGEISRWRRTTHGGQIHQVGVNFKLSQHKCPHSQYIHWTLSVNLGRCSRWSHDGLKCI